MATISYEAWRERCAPNWIPGIAPYVDALLEAGIETFEACEGGERHIYPPNQRSASTAAWTRASVPSLWPFGMASRSVRSAAIGLCAMMSLMATTGK